MYSRGQAACLHSYQLLISQYCLQLMLSSDEEAFGGFENLSKKHDTEFVSTAGDYDKRPHSLQVIIEIAAQ